MVCPNHAQAHSKTVPSSMSERGNRNKIEKLICRKSLVGELAHEEL